MQLGNMNFLAVFLLEHFNNPRLYYIKTVTLFTLRNDVFTILIKFPQPIAFDNGRLYRIFNFIGE